MVTHNIHELDTLLAAIQSGYQPKYLFFWGHQPSRGGQLGKHCLSQWWASSFEIEGQRYPTAEHFMMAEKARLFEDKSIREQILSADSPRAAKGLGRKVRNFDQEVWTAHRFEIVVRGNEAKFGQNAALKTFLLATGDQILVEASPVDRIWGIGLAEDDLRASDPTQWRGLNLLGFALMVVRTRLYR